MRKKLLIMTLALVALLGLSTVCASAASGTTRTIYVNASLTESADPNFQTLDAALTYAVGTSVTEDSVEIILQADTTMTAAYTVTRNITIKSEGGPYTVTNSAAFTVNSGGTMTLENVRVTSASDPTLSWTVNSGGSLIMNDKATLTRNRIYVNGANANFTMNGGTITGNSVNGYSSNEAGGGVYINNGGTFTMNGGEISNNTVTNSNYYGGGGVWLYRSTFTMNGGTITGNTASPGYGGGVGCWNSTFIMNDGTISNNTTGDAGGGVCTSYGGIFTMNGGIITGNTAAGSRGTSGGGVARYSSSDTFNLSGKAVVKDNKLPSGSLNNVYGIPTLTGPLTEGAEVWINYHTAVGATFATASTTDDAEVSAQYFHNDVDSTLPAIADGTSLKWGKIVAEIWENNDMIGRYLSLSTAITAYTSTDTQMILLLEDITTPSTVDKDIYLNLNGKNITGALTMNANCTLYGLDSATDGYTTSNYGKISGTISGAGTVAAITPTTAAHTTKAKSYLKVTEGDEVSFHRFNVQVSDYYFRLVYDENNANDTGSAMINFNSAVQGDSHVADAITGLELSFSTAGQAEEKTSVLTSDLAALKTALNAGNTYYHRSHFIFLSNPYTEQYALKASLDFDIGSGQTATAITSKNRSLQDILGYFIKEATQEQKTIINEFLTRNGLQTFS